MKLQNNKKIPELLFLEPLLWSVNVGNQREKLALIMTCNLNELSTIEGKHLIGVSDTVNILGTAKTSSNQVWTGYIELHQS